MTRASWHIVSSDHSAVRVCVDAWSSPLICAFRYKKHGTRRFQLMLFAETYAPCPVISSTKWYPYQVTRVKMDLLSVRVDQRFYASCSAQSHGELWTESVIRENRVTRMMKINLWNVTETFCKYLRTTYRSTSTLFSSYRHIFVFILSNDVIELLIVVFWLLTPCRLVSGYRRFGKTCLLHLQGSTSTLKMM